MDGVLFHGESPLPGAAALLDALADTPHLFLTNNPILTPSQVCEKFARIGLPVPQPDRVLTSAVATASWLSEQRPGFRYFAIGAAGLHRALAAVGTEDAAKADYVVVGEGPGLDYDTLTVATNLILKQGAQLVVTNPDHNVDAVLDGHHRVLPGGGALVAPLVVATGRQALVVGKPEPLLYEMALMRLGVRAQDAIMVGDRPDTDIAGAARLGIQTALVRTGRFAGQDPWPADVPHPDWDCDSLVALMRVWRKQHPQLLRAVG